MSPAGPAPTIPTSVLSALTPASRTAPPGPGRHRRTAWRGHSGLRGGAARAASETTSRAPLMPSGWPERDRAAVDVDALGVEPELADDGERSATRTPRSARPGRSRRPRRPCARAACARPGSGPMPITRGSTPADGAAAEPRRAARRRARRRRSSLAITSAAAPSFMPLELPAVTLPPARKAGLSAASFSARRVAAAGARRASTLADRHQLVGEAPGRLRRRPALLRAQREGVLVLARDVPALGHVLAGLAHASSGNIASIRGLGSASRASCRRPCGCRARSASGLAITSGARVIDSTPPATNRSPSPADHGVAAATTAAARRRTAG